MPEKPFLGTVTLTEKFYLIILGYLNKLYKNAAENKKQSKQTEIPEAFAAVV